VPLMRPSGGLSHPAAKPIPRRAPVACANLASVVADGHLRPPFRRATTGRVACIRPAGCRCASPAPVRATITA
jgi:hypothetical protein